MADSSPTFEELLAHSHWLRALARRLVGEAGAEDVVQEVWLRAVRRPPTTVRSPRGWLAAVLHSVAVRRAERASAAQSRDRAVARVEELPATDEVVAVVEGHRLLAEAVLRLDEPYRRTLVRHFYGGLSPSQIALEDGLPASTVRTRIARGLARLRDLLTEDHGDQRRWVLAIAPLALPARSAPAALPAGLATLLMSKPVVAVLIVALLLAALIPVFGPGEAPRSEDGPRPGLEPVASASLADPTAAEAARQPVAPATPPAVVETPPPTDGVFGRVLDPDGVPIAGATVYDATLAEVGEARARERELAGASAVTDEAGRFALVDLQPGSIVLTAWRDGFAPSVEVTIQRDERERTADVELLLRVGAALGGRVLDLDGAPAAGRRVQVTCMALHEFEVVTADADGRFALDHLTPATWRVETWPSEEELRARGEDPNGPADLFRHLARSDVALADGELQEIELGGPIDAAATVSGRLLLGDRPTSGLMRWTDRRDPTSDQLLQIGSDGSYTIDLPRAGTWTVRGTVIGSNGIAQPQVVDVAPGVTEGFDVALVGALLEGRVVDESGRAVEGVRLSLRVEEGTARRPAPTLGGATPVSDEEGRFDFELLAPGTYAITAYGVAADGDRPALATTLSEPLTVRDDRSTVSVELTLPRGTPIAGRVLDGLGRPAAGAVVFVHGEDGRPLTPFAWQRTAEDGAFETLPLPRAVVWLTAVRRGEVSPPQRVDLARPSEQPLELALGPGQYLHLDWSLPGIDPRLTDPFFEVTDGEGRRWGGLWDLRGLLDVPPVADDLHLPLAGPLPVGVYSARVSVGPHGADGAAVLDGGEPAVVRAVLAPGG